MTDPAQVRQAAENAGNVVLRPADQSVMDWADRARIALCAAAAAGYQPYADRLSIHLDLVADDAAAIVLDRRRWRELTPSVQALLACAADPNEARLDEQRLVITAQVAGYAGFQARLLAGWAPGLRVHNGSRERRPVDGLPTVDEIFLDVAWVAAPVSPPLELCAAVAALLPKVDRELVALAVSLASGCEQGVSHHGRRHVRLSGDETTAVALAAKGPCAVPGQRERAIAQVATQLAHTPAALAEQDLAWLGLDEAHRVVAVAALSTWETRLAITLGRVPA